MSEDKKINPKIYAVDIRKFILITPEIDKNNLKKVVSDVGFSLKPLTKKDSGLYILEATAVPINRLQEFNEKLLDLKNSLYKEQISFLENEFGCLQLDKKVTKLVSSFLVEANKDKNVDENKVFMVLKNILGNLYKEASEEIDFLNDDVLLSLAKAASATNKESSESHLNMALLNTLKEIRKMGLLWFNEVISLEFYNLRTDRKEVYKLHEDKELIINGIKHEIIPVNIKNKKITLAYSDAEFSLVTFDLGRKNQEMVLPIIAMFFVDKAGLKWRLNYSRILIKGIERLKTEIKYQIHNLKFNYEEVDIQDLLKIKEDFNSSFDFFYRMLTDFKNDFETENEAIKRHYNIDYSRDVSKILGGAISNAVRKVTPLNILSESDEIINDLKLTISEISNLKFEVMGIINELIESKRKKNPSTFKKAILKLQEVGENITAKYLTELTERLLKDKE